MSRDNASIMNARTYLRLFDRQTRLLLGSGLAYAVVLAGTTFAFPTRSALSITIFFGQPPLLLGVALARVNLTVSHCPSAKLIPRFRWSFWQWNLGLALVSSGLWGWAWAQRFSDFSVLTPIFGATALATLSLAYPGRETNREGRIMLGVLGGLLGIVLIRMGMMDWEFDSKFLLRHQDVFIPAAALLTGWQVWTSCPARTRLRNQFAERKPGPREKRTSWVDGFGWGSSGRKLGGFAPGAPVHRLVQRCFRFPDQPGPTAPRRMPFAHGN